MKKLFTLILMALAIVTGAKAQGTQLILGGQGENEEHSWGWNRPISTDETIYFDKAWGEFWLAQNLNGAKKYRLTVEEPNSKINLRINNSESAEGNDKNQYKAITSKVMEGELTSTDTGIELQATEAGQIIHVVSFVLIDESGKEEQTSYATNWGTSFVGGQYTSTGQWAELYMKSVAGRETQQIQINFGEAVESGKLHLKAYYTDDTQGYFDISGTTAKITLEKAVKAVSLQAKTTDAVIVKINSVYTYEIPSFSAVTISSTLSGTHENIPVVANGEALFADLSDEATNDFVINSITITPVGSFQRVQGQFRLTSEDGNTQIEPKSGGFETVPFTYDSTDDVWKAENLKLEVAGSDLDANTNYILEFYFEGSTDGNTYDYTYKNGENNFKVKFQNGTPPVQFKAENTATMTLNVDGTATTINFNKDGSVYNNGNDDLGEVSVLRITGFTTTVISSVAASSNLECWITKADGSASTQEWGGMYTDNVTTSGDEQSFTATVTNTDIISITDNGIGLTDGETYILHGYFQVKDTDGHHYFAPNKDNGESFAIQFTYKVPAFTGASINLTTGDTAEDITLTDNMTEAVSYENVEKFIINSASATTVGSVSNATLNYLIYTDGTLDGQERSLALTNDGSGNWTATINQDFVQAFNWTPGTDYTIEFWFEGYDTTNDKTIKWDNSGYNYIVDITVKETSTGINGISTDEADENEEIYNIAGQKVGKNYKGLVIKNGKKQIVK